MKKYDQEKVRMGLLPFDSLKEVARVLTFGSKKYTDYGWKQVENGYQRYEDALLRHLTDHKNGEIYDDESKLYHLSHLACCSLMMLWHFMNPEITEEEMENAKIVSLHDVITEEKITEFCERYTI